jgi:hypothetical protein
MSMPLIFLGGCCRTYQDDIQSHNSLQEGQYGIMQVITSNSINNADNGDDGDGDN